MEASSPKRLVHRLARCAGIPGPSAGSGNWLASAAAHLGFGTSCGAVYATVVPRSTASCGIAFAFGSGQPRTPAGSGAGAAAAARHEQSAAVLDNSDRPRGLRRGPRHHAGEVGPGPREAHPAAVAVAPKPAARPAASRDPAHPRVGDDSTARRCFADHRWVRSTRALDREIKLQERPLDRRGERQPSPLPHQRGHGGTSRPNGHTWRSPCALTAAAASTSLASANRPCRTAPPPAMTGAIIAQRGSRPRRAKRPRYRGQGGRSGPSRLPCLSALASCLIEATEHVKLAARRRAGQVRARAVEGRCRFLVTRAPGRRFRLAASGDPTRRRPYAVSGGLSGLVRTGDCCGRRAGAVPECEGRPDDHGARSPCGGEGLVAAGSGSGPRWGVNRQMQSHGSR